MAEMREYGLQAVWLLIERKQWRRRDGRRNRRRYLGEISSFGTYWWLTSEIENGRAIDFFRLGRLLRERKIWALDRRIRRDGAR